MLISPMLFIVRGQRLLVSHRGGASRALRAPSPGAASLRYTRPPTKPLNSHRGKRLAVAAAFLVACLCLDLIVIQVREVQLLRHDASVGTNLLDLVDRHYVLDAGGFGDLRKGHDRYAAGSRKRHNTDRVTALTPVAPSRRKPNEIKMSRSISSSFRMVGSAGNMGEQSLPMHSDVHRINCSE